MLGANEHTHGTGPLATEHLDLRKRTPHTWRTSKRNCTHLLPCYALSKMSPNKLARGCCIVLIIALSVLSLIAFLKGGIYYDRTAYLCPHCGAALERSSVQFAIFEGPTWDGPTHSELKPTVLTKALNRSNLTCSNQWYHVVGSENIGFTLGSWPFLKHTWRGKLLDSAVPELVSIALTNAAAVEERFPEPRLVRVHYDPADFGPRLSHERQTIGQPPTNDIAPSAFWVPQKTKEQWTSSTNSPPASHFVLPVPQIR